MRLWLQGLMAAALMLALGTGPAAGVTLNVVGDGLTALANNRACQTGSTSCLTTDALLELDAPAFATGTINVVGGTAFVDLAIASATFTDLGGAAGALGIDTVEFFDLVYSVELPVVTLAGPPENIISTAAALGSISGSYQTSLGGGIVDALSPFALVDVVEASGLNCLITANPTCSVRFGQPGFTLPAGSGQLDFVNRFNLNTAVPEPGTGLLVGLALAGLALARRRQGR